MSNEELIDLFAPASPGPANGLTDVEGVLVGHYTRSEPPYLTGTTAVLAPGGAVAGADVRGGAPATRETDALDPRAMAPQVHAVVLSGGSAYGLDAAGGTMRWLEEHGMGLRVGTGPDEVVPVVPAAAIFDLGRGGSFRARPDTTFGYEAAAAASTGPAAQGNVGAGTGALMGNLVGRRLKGGLGTASVVTRGGLTIAVLAVVNALGQAVDPISGLPLAASLGFPGELPRFLPCSPADLQRHLGAKSPPRRITGNTVIAVVATDAALSKAEAADLARTAQSGLARAVRPAHTRFDGDTIFSLATGVRPLVAQPGVGAAPAGPGPGPHPDRPSVATTAGGRDLALALLGQLGADCMSRAIVHALLAARSVGELVCYRDAFPSVFGSQGQERRTDA